MRRIHVTNPIHDLVQFLGQIDKQARQSFPFNGEGSEWAPDVNLKSATDSFTILVDLPGVDASTVDIQVNKNVLTIKGERTKDTLEEGAKWDREESSFGSFVRQFNLPDTVDQSQISATSNNGVLRVVLRKKEEAAPIKVEVR